MSEPVSIGVPVYKGARFVGEALDSIRSQTHQEINVLISVDGGDDDDVAACRPFLADQRFRIVVQPQRLGWVANINYLMNEASGKFWYYHQQDDIVEERYVETLLTALQSETGAAVAYSDIQAFGTADWTIVQPTVRGTPGLRQLALIHDQFNGVAFRGLTRIDALRAAGGVRSNEADDFAAEVVWMLAAARWGNLIRVPEVFYRKRYHEANVHGEWIAWPPNRRDFAWCVHCRDLALEALGCHGTAHEKRLIWLAILMRLLGSRVGAPYVEPVPNETLRTRFATFLGLCEPRQQLICRRLGLSWHATVDLSIAYVGAGDPQADLREFAELQQGEFIEDLYLRAHPDVAAGVKAGAIKSGYEHYLAFGRSERRVLSRL